MNFSEALESLKLYNKIQRDVWVDDDIYLYLVQSYSINGHLHPDNPESELPELSPDGSKNITQGKSGQMLAHILMKTAGNSNYWGENHSDYIPWIPLHTDILSDDWSILT